MKKVVVFSLLVLFSMNSYSEDRYASRIDIDRVRAVDGWIFFSVAQDVNHTCRNSSGERFKFRSTNDQGRARLSVLLSAKAQNKPIDIWYRSSGFTGSGRCSWDDVAEVRGIGFR